MHIHQSLVDEYGHNIFSDAEGQPTAQFAHFIAGQQAALSEFTLQLAPKDNSFHRLANPYASPNNACRSYDNRAAGLRIPASGPEARRVENRLSGADANPYLALAASLGAGIYGLVQGLQPTPPAQGEFVVPEALRLPDSMNEALQRLQRSTLARELFGEEFVDGYLATKSLELASFLEEISPWERRVLASQL
jgi:glutamine synthetase